jgi:hypothetical protein
MSLPHADPLPRQALSCAAATAPPPADRHFKLLQTNGVDCDDDCDDGKDVTNKITFTLLEHPSTGTYQSDTLTVYHDMTYDGLRVLLAKMTGDFPAWRHLKVWHLGTQLKGEDRDVRKLRAPAT